jgi:hypothetical protein
MPTREPNRIDLAHWTVTMTFTRRTGFGRPRAWFPIRWRLPLAAARHWGIQVHAMQHVAALGELMTTAGTSVKNVVGNYWTVGVAVVIR